MHVVIEEVGKRFGRVTALAGVSLALPSGSRTALIGPNGSGKSTLTRALLGMLGCTGRILVDGVPLPDTGMAHRQRVAYVPQIAPRLAAPVRDVVRAVAGLRQCQVALVGELAATLGLDLDALARRPFRALSGGQRQKVLAALALSADADLLLLDDPTASMDPVSRAAFFGLVEARAATTTIVLCSHRLDEIRRLVDQVVVLQDGKVAWSGPADGYLEAHAEAIVELRVAGAEAETWLATHGFRRGVAGWWSRSLPVGDRAALLRLVGQQLNGQVRDLLARDVERLAPARQEGQP